MPLPLQQGVSHHCSLLHPARTATGLAHSQPGGFIGQSSLSLPAARAQNLLCRSELQVEQEPSSWCSEAPGLHQTRHLHAQPDKLRLCLLLLGAVGVTVAAGFGRDLVHLLFSISDVVQSAHLLPQLLCLMRQIFQQCMLRRV